MRSFFESSALHATRAITALVGIAVLITGCSADTPVTTPGGASAAPGGRPESPAATAGGGRGEW